MYPSIRRPASAQFVAGPRARCAVAGASASANARHVPAWDLPP